MKRIATLAAWISLGLASTLHAQPQDRNGRDLPPGEMVAGKVTSTSKDALVIVPLAGGDPVIVKVSEDTRIMKERQPVKLSDVKTDDVVFVRGQRNGGAMIAVLVGVVNPEMAQRMQQGGFGMGRGSGGGFIGGATGSTFTREDLGKKFIAGEVKAINETKLTIARPDGENQEIEVDENTSFRRGRESITLPDIKVGDFVRGPGELKNNIFVPKELAIGRPTRMRGGDSANSPQPSGSSPAEKPPAQAPPKN
jgi:hypothetical protein